jgi:hypothetical protein
MTRYYEGAHDFTSATVTGIGGGQTVFDAIVDAAGGEDYTTLGAAVTAGHKFILVKDGTTTEVGAIVLPNDSCIVGESQTAIVNMQTNLLTVGARCILQNLGIRSANTSGQIKLDGDDTIFQNCSFTNNHVSNPGARVGQVDDYNVAKARIRFDNCKFYSATAATDIDNRQSINQQSATSTQWQITNCTFIGFATTTRISGIRFSGTDNVASNITFTDWGEANDVMIMNLGLNNIVSNITAQNCLGRIYNSTGGNSFVVNGLTTSSAINIYVDVDGCVFSNITTAGTFTVAATGNNNTVSNSIFEGGISILGDLTTISACRAGVEAGGGANTITIASGADNNIVIGCKTDVAISDSGSGNILTSNQVY